MQKAKNRRPLPGGGAPLNATRSARADVALDEIGVDRSGEARVVQLQADEFASALAGARPAGADLDLADERPEVGLRLAALLARVIVTLALGRWSGSCRRSRSMAASALGRRCGEA